MSEVESALAPQTGGISDADLDITDVGSSGPVVAAGIAGVPIVAITSSVEQLSGRKLASHIMDALSSVGLTSELPE